MMPFKNLLRTLFVGTLTGAVLSAWFSPTLITYWFAPPVDIALTCKPAVEWGLLAYRKMLLVGGCVGFVISVVFIFARLGSKKGSQSPQSHKRLEG